MLLSSDTRLPASVKWIRFINTRTGQLITILRSKNHAVATKDVMSTMVYDGAIGTLLSDTNVR